VPFPTGATASSNAVRILALYKRLIATQRHNVHFIGQFTSWRIERGTNTADLCVSPSLKQVLVSICRLSIVPE
jgi:stage V sporulation protein SpoVS